MKKLTCFILCMVLALTLCACGNNISTEKNSPEDLAATCVEAFVEKDFETMLETFPSFVVCSYALAFCKNPNANIEAVALVRLSMM